MTSTEPPYDSPQPHYASDSAVVPPKRKNTALVVAVAALVGVLVLGIAVVVLLKQDATSSATGSVPKSTTSSSNSALDQVDQYSAGQMPWSTRSRFLKEVRSGDRFRLAEDNRLEEQGMFVCDALDAAPYAFTFDEIFQSMSDTTHMSAEPIGQIAGVSVRVLCPRHLGLMEEYLR